MNSDYQLKYQNLAHNTKRVDTTRFWYYSLAKFFEKMLAESLEALKPYSKQIIDRLLSSGSAAIDRHGFVW